jgi:CBS domain-containing protein
MSMSIRIHIKSVVSITPRASVLEASQLMKARNVGAIVVLSDDGKPMGMLTDRDVAIRVVAEDRDPQSTLAEEVMTAPAATLRPDSSLREATELMRRSGIRRVAIVDESGQLCGIVSLDDILVALGMELGNVAGAIFTEISTETLGKGRPSQSVAG